jgi:hypothetical protein
LLVLVLVAAALELHKNSPNWTTMKLITLNAQMGQSSDMNFVIRTPTPRKLW